MMQILISCYCTTQPKSAPTNALRKKPDLSRNALDPEEEQKGVELTSKHGLPD
jgi:hypothetical protein